MRKGAVLFNELVHRYERELYRYLARYLGDPTAAEDVFQNTFLQVHLKRGLFENGRPFRPWLYAIATHQAVDALRKAGRHPTVSLDSVSSAARSESEAGNLIDLLVSENASPLVELQESERQQWVRDSIAKLPDALRQTLILAYHQDLKYREIAEILKIPVGTVKSACMPPWRNSSRWRNRQSASGMNEAMNAEKMIETVLSGAEGELLEQAFHGDLIQVARAEKLRLAIDRLLDDGTPFEHPTDLAARTVSFVARNRRRPLTLREQVASRVPFRWADIAVAASIFIAGALTLLPAIHARVRA